MNNRAVVVQPMVCCLLFMGLFSLAGCASISVKFAEKAVALGLTKEIVIGQPFRHVLFRKTGSPLNTLHIYLDGDGTPMIAGRPTDEATPENPLVLKLMAQDPAPAVYLGRPCYHGTAADPSCEAFWWTNGRYSQEVVSSLSTAVKRLLEQGAYESITWIGHSGGGSLAVLLAPHFPQTRAVVTIAANLDTTAWAAHAGDLDLSGSLNPVSMPPLPGNIVQKHYAGELDLVVPPSLMASAATYLGGDWIVIKGFDHQCCWERIWPSPLTE